MKADPETEAAVLDVLKRFVEAYGNRDADEIIRLFAPDPDLVVIGTGEDELTVGADENRAHFTQRDFAQAEAISVRLEWVSPISSAGRVAWVATKWVIDWKAGGVEDRLLVRRTLVLENRGGEWLIVQSHLSEPARGQRRGQAWRTPIELMASAVGAERPDFGVHAAPDGTVTILFTDIEDSTAITERLGDIRWLEVLRAHNAIVREKSTMYGCFEVKSQGDAFMIASQSARRGLQCAIDIQRVLSRYNETAREPLYVRIGLHTGEVLRDADDFFGKHVILASRIANEARGGQILVSSLLKDLTESAGDMPFGEGRDVELKGLSGTYRIFEVLWREDET